MKKERITENAAGENNRQEFYGHGGIFACHEARRPLPQYFHLRSHSQVLSLTLVFYSVISFV